MVSLRHLYRLVYAVVISAMAMSVVSCGSSKSIAGSSGRVKTTAHSGKSSKKVDRGSKSHKIDVKGLDSTTASLLSEAASWEGTPYLYGGNTRDGVDCSGFVLQVYNRALGIALPRTSAQQHDYCTKIKKSELVPGDLVFFATSQSHDNVSHVGIYIGDNTMIHSSSSKGVVKSDLGSNYYITHYYGAGRVERFHAMKGKKSSKKEEKEGKNEEKGKNETPTQPKPEQPVLAEASVPAKRSKKQAENNSASTQAEKQAKPTKKQAAKEPSKQQPSKADQAPAQAPMASTTTVETYSEQIAKAQKPTAAPHRGMRQSSDASAASTSTDSYRNKVLSGLPDKNL